MTEEQQQQRRNEIMAAHVAGKKYAKRRTSNLVQFNVTISPECREYVAALAEARRMPKGEWLDRLIRKEVARIERKTPMS